MKKLSLRSLVFTFFFLVFSQVSFATPGCRYPPYIFYVINQSAPQDGKEYYTRDKYQLVTSTVDCSTTANQNLSYIKSSEITLRSSTIDCRTYLGGSNAYYRGTAIEFTIVYHCPIDDYIPYILLAILPAAFYFSRKRMVFN